MHYMATNQTYKENANRNYIRTLRTVMNPGSNTPKKKQQYGHLPFISYTIQVKRKRHAEHSWRSKDELISDGLFCRLCEEKTESVDREKSDCPIITPTEYKERHHKTEHYIHWKECKC